MLRRPLHPLSVRPLSRCLSVALSLRRSIALSLCLLTLCPALSASPAPQRVVQDGIAVECELLPATPAGPAPRAGQPARIRFSITDTTAGEPFTRLGPAAWLGRREAAGAAPRTCAEKIREFLGGSIFAKADADLNTFRVLALNDDATITVVDPLFGFGGTKLLALVPLASPGADWALAPDNSRLFVTQPEAGRVAVVDTSDWRLIANLPVDGAPARAALQPDGHHLWVTHDGGVSVITATAAEPALVARIATGAGPHEIVFAADQHRAFVANRGDRSLSVIDLGTLQKTHDIPLGAAPASLAYSGLGASVYVVTAPSNDAPSDSGPAPTTGEILVVDATRPAIAARIAVPRGIARLRFAPGDRFALALAPDADRVHILDAATNRLVQEATVEGGPEQVAFSDTVAFVRRRATPLVAMLPLREIGREGQPLALGEFTGGEAPFGPATALADSLMTTPGKSSVVVANPVDQAIYFYMVGMAAPMGNFGNYKRTPRAVMVVDHSLRETEPGVYETTVQLPAAGPHDLVFFLNTPRIAHCFPIDIPENPDLAAAHPGAGLRLEPLAPAELQAGAEARITFRLTGPDRAAPLPPPDLVFRVLLAPGVWHRRVAAEYAADGRALLRFTPPESGMYYLYAEAPSVGLHPGHSAQLVLEASEPPPAQPIQ